MLPLNFDMNLLVVLDVLIEERSVTRTGVRLGRTQSAISNSLRKLREALDDSLLVRGQGGMVLTPKAIALQSQVQAILGMTQKCLAPQQAFDPATAAGHIRMSAPDRLTLPVMLPLLKTLRRTAPGISIDLIHADREHALNGLDEDKLDVSIGWIDTPAARFNSSFLFSDFLTYVCRKDHPLARQKSHVTVEQILSFPQLTVSGASNRKAAFDDILTRRGLQRQVAISVSNFSTVASLLREGDLIGVYAGRVAAVLAASPDICAFQLPADIAKFDHYLVWHSRHDNDPRHQWLRDQVVATAGLQQPTGIQ